MVKMGVKSKSAREALEGLQGTDPGQLIQMAYKRGQSGSGRPPAQPGPPQGAVRSAPASANPGAWRPVPGAAPSPGWRNVPPAPIAQPAQARQKVPWRDVFATFLGLPRAQAPSAQPTQPPAQTPATPQAGQKPRFRVPLVSYPSQTTPQAQLGLAPPPAPITPRPSPTPSPVAQPAAPQEHTWPGKETGVDMPPDIGSLEEYNALPKGTLFRWMGGGPHNGRYFVAHMHPAEGRQVVFGQAPPAKQ